MFRHSQDPIKRIMRGEIRGQSKLPFGTDIYSGPLDLDNWLVLAEGQHVSDFYHSIQTQFRSALGAFEKSQKNNTYPSESECVTAARNGALGLLPGLAIQAMNASHNAHDHGQHTYGGGQQVFP